MGDIGALRGLPSFPTAVNATGQVLGYGALRVVGSPRSAFLWTVVDGMTELDVLPGFEESAAYDVNDASQIAGISVRCTSAHAFYWTPGVHPRARKLWAPMQSIVLT